MTYPLVLQNTCQALEVNMGQDEATARPPRTPSHKRWHGKSEFTVPSTLGVCAQERRFQSEGTNLYSGKRSQFVDKMRKASVATTAVGRPWKCGRVKSLSPLGIDLARCEGDGEAIDAISLSSRHLPDDAVICTAHAPIITQYHSIPDKHQTEKESGMEKLPGRKQGSDR